MTYDQLDRLTAVQNVFGQVLTYSLDAASRVTQRQDSLGGVLTSVYDNADRLTSRKFSNAAGTLRIDPGYDNRNELTSLTRYSDLAGTQVVGTTTYGFDDSSRVTSIVNKNGSSSTLSAYTYTYDSADRVSSEARWSQVGTFTYSGTNTYTYDAASQLLGDGTNNYSYNANGNRTMAGYQTGTGNRLTTDGLWTYQAPGRQLPAGLHPRRPGQHGLQPVPAGRPRGPAPARVNHKAGWKTPAPPATMTESVYQPPWTPSRSTSNHARNTRLRPYRTGSGTPRRPRGRPAGHPSRAAAGRPRGGSRRGPE
jgi:YD repeat-containing protein